MNFLVLLCTGNVTFSIASNTASNKFAIMPSGLVVLQDSLDREEVAHYFVSIVARSNKLLDISILEVIVVDENDNSPEFRPGSCYTLAVPENQEDSAIHTIAATDPDEGKNGEIGYSIAGESSRILLSQMYKFNFYFILFFLFQKATSAPNLRSTE